MWSEHIDETLVILNPDVKNKAELFERMASHAYNQDLVIDRKAYLRALQEREDKANTELAPGVALPHARCEACERLFLCIIIINEGLDYGNPEMGPARIMFFFGAPEKENREYLQLLARSSRLLRNDEFREQLLAAKTPRDVLDLLAIHDKHVEENGGLVSYSMEIVLHDREKLDIMLESLVELGVTNAAVIDCQSMARKLAYEMPVFAGLSYMSPNKSMESTLITCTVRDRSLGTRLFKLMRENGVDLNRPNQGYIRMIRIDEVIGEPEETVEL